MNAKNCNYQEKTDLHLCKSLLSLRFQSWASSFYELWNLFTQHLGNLPDSKNQRKKHVWRRASSSHLKVEIPRHRHKWIFCLVWTFEFIYTIWSVILSYTKLGIFYHIHSCQNRIISSGTDEFRVCVTSLWMGTFGQICV